MKRNIALFLLSFVLIMFALLLAGFAEGNIPSVVLSESDISIYKGKEIKLKYTLSGIDSSQKSKVTWRSSDSKVASVTSGTVSGIGAGVADITCEIKLKDGTMISDTCRVTVNIAVTEISFKKQQLTVYVGQASTPIEYKISPAKATCQDVTWESTDESILKVNQEGVATGISTGKASIVITSKDKVSKPKQAKIRVTVLQGVTKISVEKANLSIDKGKNYKLKVSVYPDTASDPTVKWQSSDKTVATIENGSIKALKGGECDIIVSSKSNPEVTAKCHVTVVQKMTSMKISPSNIKIDMMDSAYLSLTIQPQNTTNKKCIWKSSNPRIATVDTKGKVTGVSEGDCVITCTAQDGSDVSSSVKVHVNLIVMIEKPDATVIGNTIMTNFCAIQIDQVKIAETLEYRENGRWAMSSTSVNDDNLCMIGRILNTSGKKYHVDISGNCVANGEKYEVRSWVPFGDDLEPYQEETIYIYTAIPINKIFKMTSCYFQIGFNENFEYSTMSYDDCDYRYVYRYITSARDKASDIYTEGNAFLPRSNKITLYDSFDKAIGGTVKNKSANITFEQFRTFNWINYRYKSNMGDNILPEKEGYKYVCLQGRINNISNKSFVPWISGKIVLDQYEFELQIADIKKVMTSLNFGLLVSSNHTLDPFEEGLIYVYACIPDEIADTFSSCKIIMNIPDTLEKGGNESTYTYIYR